MRFIFFAKKVNFCYILCVFNPKLKNSAFIDGANLHKGVKELGWKLDYHHLRVWLKDKFKVNNAYIFLGLIPDQKDLYIKLQEAGYILIYKEITYDGTGKVKGNCDADLVLKVIRDFYEQKFSQAVIISSDGDYSGLVKFLKEKRVFLSLVSPSNKCSYLLRKLNIPIVYLETQRKKIEYKPLKEKAPGRNEIR